ncbi:abhydrolase domain-containing protein 11 [Trichonephila inaurata madagascariensis]|uniref:sn-1-specific diacylglycerol lipase ABHD11 n=1 Tax=Trichonephila inaurata madagascariensis TaxID=2747483 RepID=A0A8X6MD66_9ARAC|nr:abhydrolase domain-containing protein 11 [Trichonephila inaurata madagascariensis]
MGVNKSSSVTYGDTASSFLAKRIGDYVAANNDRFQHTKNSLRSTTSNETECHETSEKGFVPVHINYKTFDPKEGPDEGLVPIIFQHGALASIENWGNMPQILADETKRKVYALDARNHGDSEWSEASDRETLAQDLIYFMNTNGITKCILIGHSMGGMSGLLAALMQPAMFEMLFLEDCAVSPLPQKLRDLIPTYLSILQGILSEIPPSIKEEEVRIFVKEKLEKLLPKDPVWLHYPDNKGERKPEQEKIRQLTCTKRHKMFTKNDEKVDISYCEMTKILSDVLYLYETKNVKTRRSQGLPFTIKRNSDGRYSLKTNIAAVVPSFISSWPDPKGAYEGPAFFIYGTNSPHEVYNDKECIKRHFPNAELIPIEGAGHAIHMSCPDEFMGIILKRLKNPQSTQMFQKNKL